MKQSLIPRQLVGSDPATDRLEGLEAATADPLWFLARQWQLGEFEAVGGGSLVSVEVTSHEAPLTELRFDAPTKGEFENLCDPQLPLEVAVESGNSERFAPTGEISAEQLSTAPRGWDPQRHAYLFSVRTAGGTELTAESYNGSRLDWYHLRASELPASVAPARTTHVVPSPVRFPGMPKDRWWELDDPSLDLGQLERPELNVLTMLLLEYALVLSRDWFYVPLRQTAGSLRTVITVTVRDSLDNRVDVEPEPAATPGDFAMFALASAAGASSRHHLLIATKDDSLSGAPLEEVIFVRDEQSNLVWAVETTPRAAPPRPAAPGHPASPIEPSLPRYRATGEAPAHWIPYVAVQASGQPTGQMELHRARTLQSSAQTGIVGTTTVLREEQVPSFPMAIQQHLEAIRVGDERWTLELDPLPRLLVADERRYVLWLGRRNRPARLAEHLTFGHDVLVEPVPGR